MNFRFTDEKNRRLSEMRGVTFENVIEAIAEHGVLAEYEHPNQEKYPGQRIMVVRINNYPQLCTLLYRRRNDRPQNRVPKSEVPLLD